MSYVWDQKTQKMGGQALKMTIHGTQIDTFFIQTVRWVYLGEVGVIQFKLVEKEIISSRGAHCSMGHFFFFADTTFGHQMAMHVVVRYRKCS